MVEREKYMRNINNHYSDLSKEIKDRMDHVWDYIIYKEIKDKKVEELERLNKDLREDLDDMKYENSRLNRELNKYKKKKFMNQLSGNKRKASDAFNLNKYMKDSLKKSKNYVKVSDISGLFKSILKGLNSIKDIIKLEDHQNRCQLKKFDKFKKMYKLIPVLKEIDSLIGMEKCKEQLFKHISYFIHGASTGSEIMHMKITGPPGVGKTTLANILAKIYLHLDFLKNDNVVVARRSDLIGRYCGETAIKTQKVIDSAEGGVLLIDEAYSLGNREKRDVFTKECIDTINQNLTEKKGKFLCIIAGYKKELEECFFSYNPGLARRFPISYEVEEYSPMDMIKIWDYIAKKNKWETEAFPDDLMSSNMIYFKNFGGDLEVLFNKAAEYYCLRLMKESINITDIKKKLIKEDIAKAVDCFIEDKREKELPEFVKHMYL